MRFPFIGPLLDQFLKKDLIPVIAPDLAVKPDVIVEHRKSDGVETLNKATASQVRRLSLEELPHR